MGGIFLLVYPSLSGLTAVTACVPAGPSRTQRARPRSALVMRGPRLTWRGARSAFSNSARCDAMQAGSAAAQQLSPDLEPRLAFDGPRSLLASNDANTT